MFESIRTRIAVAKFRKVSKLFRSKEPLINLFYLLIIMGSSAIAGIGLTVLLKEGALTSVFEYYVVGALFMLFGFGWVITLFKFDNGAYHICGLLIGAFMITGHLFLVKVFAVLFLMCWTLDMANYCFESNDKRKKKHGAKSKQKSN